MLLLFSRFAGVKRRRGSKEIEHGAKRHCVSIHANAAKGKLQAAADVKTAVHVNNDAMLAMPCTEAAHSNS